MNRRFISIIIVFILISTTIIGCSGKTVEPEGDVPPLEDEESEQEEPEEEDELEKEDPIITKIEEMTLEEKIGQMVIVGLDGYTLDDNTKTMIEEYHVGGFILFSKNIESPQQMLKLTNDLKSQNINNKTPIFISVDEEGGIVSRMPNELVKIPSNNVIGEIRDRNFSYNIGSVIGEEIKSFGFNMNFAPVLDINSNPNNSVIGNRSFGADEKIVKELGIETMKGMQSKGIIPVVKHFPGHGDTSEDSHIGLPIINKDIESLMNFELVPFIESINNGTDGIMVAHILFNDIDSENPATLSKEIINDFLREELGFDGLVITDDMTMGAILENYDIGDAAVKSVNAGSDIILVCHGYENQINVLNELKNAVNNGNISEERINESVYRILKVKEKYKLEDKIIEDINVEKINNDIRKVLSEKGIH